MTNKWIFFDLDDTLFDFSKASHISLHMLWEEISQLQNKFPTADSFIDEYHIHNSLMWKLHESGRITSDFLKPERFRLTLCPDMHDDKTIDFCRELNDRYLHRLGKCKCVCPGVHEMLEYLQGKCLIGVLTNGFSEVQYEKIKTNGLDRFIQRMVISDEIGIQKPDTRLFRYAESSTGATPGNIYMIGDNPENDIRGAVAAGWKAVYYDRKGKPLTTDSDLLLGSTSDIMEAALLCLDD